MFREFNPWGVAFNARPEVVAVGVPAGDVSSGNVVFRVFGPCDVVLDVSGCLVSFTDVVFSSCKVVSSGVVV